jgi:tungstate transport system ATP-binding protein
LEQFGIGPLRDRSAKTLSGGEAQRTSLARAFAIEPQLLFLDEPFAALDPPTRESLLEDLGRVLRTTGTTAIMATHDQTEALRLSDRIAVMNEGRIVQIGPPAEVMNHPVDEFVASFVGVETIFAGQVVSCERGTSTINVGRSAYPAADGPPPIGLTGPLSNVAEAVASDRNDLVIEVSGQARAGEKLLCCIRPEHVTLSPGLGPDRTSARNAFPALISRIRPFGAFYKVHLNGGFPLVAYVTIQSIEDLDLREGATVTASFKATAVHMIRRG